MKSKHAKADVNPVRQRTQFTCMSTSLMMCLQALGHKVTEDEVNDVMGARPKKGAAWENALAAAQHYGCRATLVTPSTVQQLKEWTDAGIPVMIAWNPEGRPWSHASVVFDVDEDLNVYVADPNIPDPDETVRIVPKAEFYSKWSEKWPDYIVRRPAMAVEREITPEGRQVMASTRIQQQPLMTMPDYGLSMEERWERGFQANDTDSGAGSDEDMFFKAPDKREVLEFARSKAISNSMDVAIDHAKELDIPLLEELADVAVSPPLPTEIAMEPGGKALSTLNRYVVKTEDPAAAPAVKMNQDRMAFWKAELETR
jgi:predicted double-glycine peptidase